MLILKKGFHCWTKQSGRRDDFGGPCSGSGSRSCEHPILLGSYLFSQGGEKIQVLVFNSSATESCGSVYRVCRARQEGEGGGESILPDPRLVLECSHVV